jgi:extracellular elastinolytic metalloproteinase
MDRRPVALATAVIVAAALATSAPARSAPTAAPTPDRVPDSTVAHYDVRDGATPAQRAALRNRAAVLNARSAPRSLRSSLGRQAVVDIDPLTATPRQVARLNGTLTGRSGGSARDIAMAYIKSHLTAFGLTATDLSRLSLRRDYVDVAGTHHLSWVQSLRGVAVFGNGLQASVAKDGRLINVLGSPVHGLAGAALPTRSITSGAALQKARKALGKYRPAAVGSDRARDVVFQTPAGLRRAFETISMSASKPALQVIDARTAQVLYRQSLSANDDSLAFRFFPGARRGGVQEPVDFVANGWMTKRAVRLNGNNTHTYADVNDDNKVNGSEEIPPRHGHSWDYPLVPFHLKNVSFCDNPWPCSWNPNKPFSWEVNRNQNATQVFYFVNNWHDHLQAAPIGFTEAAGNFQQVNASGQGQGGDAVQAQTDDGANTDNGLPDGAHIDNANMATPPDGTPPVMQMYLQHTPHTSYPDEDPFSPTNVGDEADTVYHEYTHGLSNRLVVDASGRSTLGNIQAGAMGEAWSDWYAMDYLVDQGLQIDKPLEGDVLMFPYDGRGARVADRTQPLDCPVGSTSHRCAGTVTAGPGGYTYGDFGKVIGRPEVHADGEIWSETLWDLRSALGSTVSESLVTRAMELSPANPSFLDERNAILQADIADHGSAHVAAIWKVFAHRGMGFFAEALNGDDTSPIEDFSLPPSATAPRGTLSGVVSDVQTGQPLADAVVGIGGHASGFPGDWQDVTDAAGRYSIPGIVFHTYHKVSATAPGYVPAAATVAVQSPSVQKDFALLRDWAAASGGAVITAFNGPDNTEEGCGPDKAIDLTQGNGWESSADLGADGQPSSKTPKFLVVKLPQVVDIDHFLVDPGNTCGSGLSASTAGYRIDTSTDGTTFQTAAEGTFAPADAHVLVPVTPASGTGTGVQYVRFWMLSPMVYQLGGSCPGPFTGCDFLDLSELEVVAAT